MTWQRNGNLSCTMQYYYSIELYSFQPIKMLSESNVEEMEKTWKVLFFDDLEVEVAAVHSEVS